MDKKHKALSCELKVNKNHQNFFGKTALFLMAFFTAFFAKAQNAAAQPQAVDMATGMRSNGKIYVVVAVLCIILAGVFIYLINLDKKISKLEKEVNTN